MLIAHRGGVKGTTIRENTLDAFRRAMTKSGVSGIECDLRSTLDGEIVIHHDRTLDDGTEIHLTALSNLPQHVCTLYGLLALALELDFKGLLNLEIKTYNTGSTAARIVHETGISTSHILFTSFLHPEIIALKQEHPEFRYGFILACHPSAFQPFIHNDALVLKEEVIQWSSATLFEGLAPSRIFFYTVNDPDRMRELQGKGYNVVTDVL